MTYPLILLVDDDPVFRQVLFLALRGQGFDVAMARTGAEALEVVHTRRPDAMLLDLSLPDMDGVDVTAAVRAERDLPILIVSSCDDERQMIRAFDAGVTDYVTKPFREGELMARLRASLRRGSTNHWPQLRVGDLQLDVEERRAFVGANEIELTPTEFKLLLLLARETGRVVTHRRLLLELTDAKKSEDLTYVRVFVKQLRQKIERRPAQPERLLTVTGVGYRLAAVQS